MNSDDHMDDLIVKSVKSFKEYILCVIHCGTSPLG